jgi:hypothetical protein
VSFEALAQEPPAAGFIRRTNPAKNNLVMGEKMDIRGPFQCLKRNSIYFSFLEPFDDGMNLPEAF